MTVFPGGVGTFFPRPEAVRAIYEGTKKIAPARRLLVDAFTSQQDCGGILTEGGYKHTAVARSSLQLRGGSTTRAVC